MFIELKLQSVTVLHRWEGGTISEKKKEKKKRRGEEDYIDETIV